MPYEEFFLVLGGIGILYASVQAIGQRTAKRMLAYSSVAQIGYIALAVGFVSIDGLTAGLVHLFNHALMKGALFMAVGAVVYRLGSNRIEDFAGLGREMPWTMLGFTLATLSMIGVPLTAGFISKWVLLQAAIADGHWIVVGVVAVGSMLAVVYLGRIIEAAYLRPAPEGRAPVREVGLWFQLPMWVLVLANFWFGIDTSLTLGTATRGAEVLLGVGP